MRKNINRKKDSEGKICLSWSWKGKDNEKMTKTDHRANKCQERLAREGKQEAEGAWDFKNYKISKFNR